VAVAALIEGGRTLLGAEAGDSSPEAQPSTNAVNPKHPQMHLDTLNIFLLPAHRSPS
jgi:hypothetical protein